MSDYKLRYLPVFYDDLEQVTNYITDKLKNAPAAVRLVDDIEAAIKKRLAAPASFEVYESYKKRPRPYYRIYIRNYIVFYVVIDDVMEVRRLLYKKRNAGEKI